MTFWVPLALILVQVTFTRLIAYKLFYHYVFLAISLTLLGLAGAASFVSVRRRPDVPFERRLAFWLLLLAVSVPVSLQMLNLPFLIEGGGKLSVVKLRGGQGLAYLLWASPWVIWVNFCGGVLLALVFARHGASMGRIYACDLLGTGCGALLSVALMKYGSPPRAFLAAVLPALLAWYPLHRGFARGGAARRRGVFAATAALLLAAGFAFGPARLRSFDGGAARQGHLVKTEWDHLFRTDHRWGMYVLDADAATPFRIWDPSPRPLFDPCYVLAKARPKVAIIGSGGGPQVEEARRQDASSILAIDINQSIVRWVVGADRRANNGLFVHPSVRLMQGEGRHSLRSAGGRYDVINMHAVDSYSSTASGAYALSESFLYTREAFQDYYRALAPGGAMTVVRWLFNPPRENLRLLATAEAALRAEGVTRPAGHLAVFSMSEDYAGLQEQTWGVLLLTQEPLTPAQVGKLQAHAQARRWGVLYAPGVATSNPFDEYMRSEDRTAFAAEYPYRVDPVSDARPYFFQFYRPFHSASYAKREQAFRGIGMLDVYQASTVTLLATIVATLLLSLLIILLPLWLRKRADSGPDLSLRIGLLFTCLGVGFMAFEVPLVQVLSLYLGHPTYGFAVVLVALLWAAAGGSFLAYRRSPPLGRMELVVAGALLITALAMFPLVHGTIHWPAPARFGIAVALVAACGVPLGFPLALGVQALKGRGAGDHAVAWAWAVNGAASVVGSCLVMAVMIFAGTQAALALGIICYLVASWATRST